MEIPFRDGKQLGMTIPWGDVASAFYSTGIPNIEVYTTSSPKQIARLRRLRFLLPLLALEAAAVAGQAADRQERQGPVRRRARETRRSSLWGRVSDDQGKSVSATLETLERLPADGADGRGRAGTRRSRGDVPRGFSTASQAFGKEFILSFPQHRHSLGMRNGFARRTRDHSLTSRLPPVRRRAQRVDPQGQQQAHQVDRPQDADRQGNAVQHGGRGRVLHGAQQPRRRPAQRRSPPAIPRPR